jgi:hypothetical protein
MFAAEGRRVLELARRLPEAALGERVRIRRFPGIEDSSREWSVLMVVEHLLITGPAILALARRLLDGLPGGDEVSIAAVKPKGDRVVDLLDEYARFLADYDTAMESLDVRPTGGHPHPWFGPLDAARWLKLNAVHQRIHRRQVEKIIAQRPRGG